MTMQRADDQNQLTTPNPLTKRDPELVENFGTFRSKIGDRLLDSLGPLLNDHASDFLAGLHAAAQVLRVLVKGRWTTHDLETFDKYWREAMRSDLFADEFEAERHRIQACVEAARTKLLEPKAAAKSGKTTQQTLW